MMKNIYVHFYQVCNKNFHNKQANINFTYAGLLFNLQCVHTYINQANKHIQAHTHLILLLTLTKH